MKKVDYTLYVCTDQKLMSSATIEESVEQAILGGCTVIQLREKDSSSREFYETAKRVKEITEKYQVPLIINDRVDIALAVDADGVHVGQSDLPAKVVREILGEDKIIGVSAARVEEAVQAENCLLYTSPSPRDSPKTNTRSVSIEYLKKICSSVQIPIGAIGGIHEDNAASLKNTGIAGLAVVSAVVAQPDVAQAAARLKKIFVE